MYKTNRVHLLIKKRYKPDYFEDYTETGYFEACGTTEDDSNTTEDHSKVTCKSCLRYIKRQKIKYVSNLDLERYPKELQEWLLKQTS